MFGVGVNACTGGIDAASPFRSTPIPQIARAPQSENIFSPKRKAPEARVSGRSEEKISPFGTVRYAGCRFRGHAGPWSALRRGMTPISWLGTKRSGALSINYLQSRAFQRVYRCTTHKCAAFRPESGHRSGTVRKPATRYTRRWGRIPRTGKNSRRTGRMDKSTDGPRWSTLVAACKVNCKTNRQVEKLGRCL